MRISSFLSILTLLALVGCAEEPTTVTTTTTTQQVTTTGPAREVLVTQAPPPVRVETQTVTPGPGYLWTSGYWRWTGQLPEPLLEFMLGRIKLPPGFTIQLYAANVPNARSMTLGASGTVFVGSRSTGKVYALVDHNHKNKADEVITIARGLYMPNGVAFRDGALYVAEVNRVLRYDNIEVYHGSPYGLMLKAMLAGSEILAEDLLPEFQLTVADLFKMPQPQS